MSKIPENEKLEEVTQATRVDKKNLDRTFSLFHESIIIYCNF